MKQSPHGKKAKGKSKTGGILPRILLTVVGIVLIMITVNDLSLFLFGKITSTDMNVRRFAGSDDPVGDNLRYQYSVDWEFWVDGKEYQGHATQIGTPTGIDVSNEVRYFPFAPWINNLKDSTDPNPLHIIPVVLGAFIIAAMNRKSFRNPDHFKDQTEQQVLDSVTDYDDSVEEYYHDK